MGKERPSFQRKLVNANQDAPGHDRWGYRVCYSLTETGRVIRKINPKNITRERRKLKAYKRLLDSGRIDYATVENAFKSWLGSHWKYMSHGGHAN